MNFFTVLIHVHNEFNWILYRLAGYQDTASYYVSLYYMDKSTDTQKVTKPFSSVICCVMFPWSSNYVQ